MPDKGGTQDEHVKDTTAILTRLQHLCPHPHQWRVMAACHCHAWSRLSCGTRNKLSYTKHTEHRPHASKWVLLRQLPDDDKKLTKFFLRKSDAKFHCTDGDGNDSMIQRGVAKLEPNSLVCELPEFLQTTLQTHIQHPSLSLLLRSNAWEIIQTCQWQLSWGRRHRCPMNKVKPVCWKMHYHVACRTI
ncbi:hypothetical protein BDL97_16G092100 [Sphagnum fallax]|nr:hypothetical protein BDL97_16G092100 [Sphagnum fallax]